MKFGGRIFPNATGGNFPMRPEGISQCDRKKIAQCPITATMKFGGLANL